MYYKGIEAAKRIEYRTPDPSCNPYLAFAGMLCAGLDGVKRKIEPGDPVDEDLYHLSASKRKEYGVRELPGSLKEAVEHLQMDNWFVRHVGSLKTAIRVIFGVVWGIDGALKFQAGFADSLSGMISDAGQGQPGWLQPWFGFWSQAVSGNPAFFATTIGLFELALAFALLLGFMRKVAYTGGILLSLVIWSVPEGFGGPYGPASTDIGTGVIYAFVFLLLMVINAPFGPSRWSLDYAIERRWPAWKKIAEIRSAKETVTGFSREVAA